MAAVLDTAGEYFARVTSLPAAYGTWTVALWFWLESDRDTASALIYADRSAASDLYTYVDASGVTLAAFNGTAVTTGTGIRWGKWYHIALTSSGLVYLDGVLIITSSSPGAGTFASIALGAVPGGSASLIGKLAYARVWDAILTQGEIQAERPATTAQRATDLLSDDALLSSAGTWTEVGTITYDADDPLRRKFILG